MPLLNRAKVSKAIGSGDYDAAIEACRQMLADDKEDYFALSTLAFCHEWKGDTGRAVFYADRLLARFPNDLDMLLLTARYWSESGDEERTYRFVCRAIEHSAEKTPGIPSWLFWLMKPLTILKKFRDLEDQARYDIQGCRKYRVDHLIWANEYKTWYEWKNKSE